MFSLTGWLNAGVTRDEYAAQTARHLQEVSDARLQHHERHAARQPTAAQSTHPRAIESRIRRAAAK